MKIKQRTKIDIEPSWQDIVDNINAKNIEQMRPSLNQMAYACDKIRQANKNNNFLVINPDGSYTEVKRVEDEKIKKTIGKRKQK